MLVDDADRPAKWYFQLKAAHLEAQRNRPPDGASPQGAGHAALAQLRNASRGPIPPSPTGKTAIMEQSFGGGNELADDPLNTCRKKEAACLSHRCNGEEARAGQPIR